MHDVKRILVVEAVQADKTDLMIIAHHEEDRIEHYLFCRDYEEVIRKM